MYHAFLAIKCCVFFYLLSVTLCHRSSTHRSDVYIAGFFPYGDGVENAQTGIIFVLSFSLGSMYEFLYSNFLRH